MKIHAKSLFITTLLTLASVSSAYALPGAAFRPNFFRDVPSTSRELQEGHVQLAPLPFVVFCMQYPGECSANATAASVELTPEKFAELTEINHRINAAIRPQEDTSASRFWKLDVDAGDCNEYAVQKRHELIKAGWPAAALSLTVAKTTWGEGHLLVTVRTDHGDLVLDSLRQDVVAWDRANYRWIMRQSASDLTTWVALEIPSRSHHRHLHEQTAPIATAATIAPAQVPEPVTGRLTGL